MNIRKLSFFLIGGVIAFVAIYTSVLLFLTWPVSEYSVATSGVFGDSFGPLTSLFSGLAFAGLIITLLVQREELKLNRRALNEQIAEMKVQNESLVMQKEELTMQREELKYTRDELKGQKQEMRKQNEALQVQQFENTFFKMLELLETCRKEISFGRREHEKSGRDAIELMSKEFVESYLKESMKSFESGHRIRKVLAEENKNIKGLRITYSRFYQKNCDDLGQYYRVIYNILKLVDRQLILTDKAFYTNLLRAQLSRSELTLLFYNCLSELALEKMTPLVCKFKILKHLEKGELISEHDHIFESIQKGDLAALQNSE